MKRIKVHVIEDNNPDYDLIAYNLKKNTQSLFEFTRSTTMKQAMDSLAHLDSGLDVILLDLNLPDSDSTMTMKSIAKLALKAPVIVLTSMDMSKGLEAIKNGAQDFINKNSLDELYLEYKIMFSLERSGYMKHLEKAAFINPTTGMYTLRYLEYLLGDLGTLRGTVDNLNMIIIDTEYSIDDKGLSAQLEDEIRISFKYVETRLGMTYASDRNHQYVFLIDDHHHKYAYFVLEVERLLMDFCTEHDLKEIRYGIGMYNVGSEGFYDLLQLTQREVKYKSLKQ